MARWHRLYFSLMMGACVPLPLPGGPIRMIFFCGGACSLRLISARRSSVENFLSGSDMCAMGMPAVRGRRVGAQRA